MKQRINPGWANGIRDKIKAAKHPLNPTPFKPQIVSWNTAAKWLIAGIAESGQIAKVENLGAGVKRISIKGTCCPFCGKEI